MTVLASASSPKKPTLCDVWVYCSSIRVRVTMTVTVAVRLTVTTVTARRG